MLLVFFVINAQLLIVGLDSRTIGVRAREAAAPSQVNQSFRTICKFFSQQPKIPKKTFLYLLA